MQDRTPAPTLGSPPPPNCCTLRPHYGEPCECRERLAAVVTHTRASTPLGPDYCAECSEAIAEWVPWPCGGVA